MTRLIAVALFTVTAYCDGSCGKAATHPAYGIMTNGERTYRGAIACPPWIPLGAEVYLPVGKFVCGDRGGAIEGNKLDLWFSSCEEALDWGVKEMPGVVTLTVSRGIGKEER